MSGCFLLDSGDASEPFEPYDEPVGPEFSDPEPTSEPETDERVWVDVAACAGGLSDDQIANELAIVHDFDTSTHEMVTCGNLIRSIVGALMGGIVTLAEDPEQTTLPEQFQYDGAGTYFVGGDLFQDLRMEVRFYLAQDFEFGQAGDLVTANLFDASTFLQNPTSVVEGTEDLGFRIEIHHDGPGPMAELLGLGPDPASPIVLTDEDLEIVQEGLRNLDTEATIHFVDHPGVSTIAYDVVVERTLAESFLNGTALPLDMVGADGWRADLNQDLDVTRFDVRYREGGVGRLSGELDFVVRGGRFDFMTHFFFPDSSYPLITVECAPPPVHRSPVPPPTIE